MTSLFISSNNRVDNNLYKVGSKVEFHGVKLKSASILNNFFNTTGFQATVNFSGVNIPLNIPDGFYSGIDMASYLEQRLNAFGNGSQWKVYFNQGSQKFSFKYMNLNTTTAVTLSFNQPSWKYFGLTSSTFSFPANSTTFLESPNQTVLLPGYYRIESSDLSQNSMFFEDNPNSGIIGIVPINTQYGQYQTFNDSDGFYMTTSNINDIYNFINVKIYLEDSNIELQNPQFVIILHFV